MLKGISNSGKTTTLNLVYENLLKNGWTSTNKKPLGGYPKDFEDIVLDKEEKQIAFYTMGDYSLLIGRAMDFYSQLKVDILVCAANDCYIRPFQHCHEIIEKTISDETISEQNANNKDAEKILILIKQSL
jgi:hypothetical protein